MTALLQLLQMAAHYYCIRPLVLRRPLPQFTWTQTWIYPSCRRSRSTQSTVTESPGDNPDLSTPLLTWICSNVVSSIR